VPQHKHTPERRIAYSVDEAAAITGLRRDLLYDQRRVGPSSGSQGTE
jgi:hypothetical protein